MAEHSDTPQSSSTATDESGTDEVAALRNQVATLQDRLKAANNRIEAWEQCMQRLVGCVLLGPDMNDMYKEEFSALLREALGSLEQIQEVHYVECSFPSVPSEVRPARQVQTCPSHTSTRGRAGASHQPRVVDLTGPL